MTAPGDQMTRVGYDTNFEVIKGKHWWHWGRHRIIQAILSRQFSGKNLSILDYGAGTGGMLPLLSRYGRVTGVEPSPYARELARGNGMSLIAPEVLDKDAVFDLVTAFDVLEHVDEELPWLRNLSDRMKKNGHLILTVPAFSWLWTLNDIVAVHKRRYTKGTLTKCLEQVGFEVFFLTYWNSLPLAGVALVAIRDHFRLKKLKTVEGIEYTYMNIPPFPINSILKAILRMDSFWIGNGYSLPFGVSLLAVARKKEQESPHSS